MKYLKLNYQGLMINSDFEQIDNAIVQFPSNDYVAKPGESIELAYRAGNYDNAEDLLIIVLVDWQQQTISNAEYIYTRNSQDISVMALLNLLLRWKLASMK